MVWQDILLLAYTTSLKSGLSASQNIFKVYIFFSDLADSLFIVRIAAVRTATGVALAGQTAAALPADALVSTAHPNEWLLQLPCMPWYSSSRNAACRA